MINQKDFENLVSTLKSKGISVVAVSKFQPLEKIEKFYEWGHRDFGENYVQELIDKHTMLPKDIHWHFIGHLQSNKVRQIAPFVHLIHSVDSYKLLSEINRQAAQNHRTIDVLLQIYAGMEDTKYGLDEKETIDLLTVYEKQYSDFQNIRIRGFMGMATNTSDIRVILHEFAEMEALFSNMKQQFFFGKDYFDTLCMGMSSDYESAADKGSTMVRIGSSIFGARRSLPDNKFS